MRLQATRVRLDLIDGDAPCDLESGVKVRVVTAVTVDAAFAGF